jgi:hypothetical protein
MDQSIFVIELVMNDPNTIADHLNQFYKAFAAEIDDVLAVTQFVTAVQDPKSLLNTHSQPKVIYNFHFVITYTGKQIVNPQVS